MLIGDVYSSDEDDSEGLEKVDEDDLENDSPLSADVADYCHAERVREALMTQIGLSRVSVYVVLEATKRDLIAAILNPDVAGVVVVGHGTWSSWVDADGKRVTNEDLPKPANPLAFFVRHTCGIPDKDDEWDDQLGTSVASRIFGTEHVTCHLYSITSPLPEPSKALFRFNRSKSPKATDRKERRILGKKKFRTPLSRYRFILRRHFEEGFGEE